MQKRLALAGLAFGVIVPFLFLVPVYRVTHTSPCIQMGNSCVPILFTGSIPIFKSLSCMVSGVGTSINFPGDEPQYHLGCFPS
jgi:hypothetical protein